jgi:hypothetical protein
MESIQLHNDYILSEWDKNISSGVDNDFIDVEEAQ